MVNEFKKRNGYMYSTNDAPNQRNNLSRENYFPKVTLHSSQYHVPTGSLVNPTHFQ